MNKDRLRMFETYIHTNACSDECGWFAFFTPNGTVDDLPDWRVNGCETEDEAIEELVKLATFAMDYRAELGFKKLFNARTYLCAVSEDLDDLVLIHTLMDKARREIENR